MSNKRNAEIKNYICKTFVKEDTALQKTKKKNKEEGLPDIAVPENVGKLISFFAKLQQPKRILEIGTLGGYSTLWLAKGAPTADITTLECDPKHVAIAQFNFQQAGLADKITVVNGDAIKTLTALKNKKEAPFDLIFLDADKSGYPTYLPLLLALSRPGTLILTDNLIPKEELIDQPSKDDPDAVNVYHYNSMLASHPKLDTILATTIVGENGRVDAIGVSLVNS